MNVSTPTGVPDDDAYWQRPEPGSEPARHEPAAPEPRPAPRYDGPPRSAPPPPGWQPPTVSRPTPPRSMPSQDIDELDEAEGSARTVTYGVGLLAGAIAVLVICLLCARAIF